MIGYTVEVYAENVSILTGPLRPVLYNLGADRGLNFRVSILTGPLRPVLYAKAAHDSIVAYVSILTGPLRPVLSGPDIRG